MMRMALLLAGGPAKGKAMFARCAIGYTVQPGPSLAPIVGRKAAAVPGTKMVFAGLPTPADRANVIAYLKTVK